MSAEIGRSLGWRIEAYPADWETYRLAAGPIRNKLMLDQGKPELVLAFHHDLSRSSGTAHMVKISIKAGLEVEWIDYHGNLTKYPRQGALL